MRADVRRALDVAAAAIAQPKLARKPFDVRSETPQLVCRWSANNRTGHDLSALDEREQRFDATFIELARSVYRNNDRRAVIKRRINEYYSAQFMEEKDHPAY